MPFTAWDPLVATVPDHAPDAAQVDAFADDQVNVELPPLATLVGFALRETVGNAELTETVAELDAAPPGPVHPRVNLVLAFSATVD